MYQDALIHQHLHVFFFSFRLEFESQCGRLRAQMDYEQNQLELQKKKLHKMEETILKEERAMAEQKKVFIPGPSSV